MKHKKYPEEFEATKLKPLMQLVARMVQKNPEMADNMDWLWTNLLQSVPELKDKSKCGACGRSMKITIYEAGLHDALLILAMAQEVRKNLEKGIPFTEANKVHLPTLNASHTTIKRQTKCDYLGLIKQPENWKGTGYWLLTRWAWQTLRGEKIPRAVKYWEGKLLGRSQATTTLAEMFSTHRKLVEQSIAKRKAVKADYRVKFDDYNPHEWTEYALRG